MHIQIARKYAKERSEVRHWVSVYLACTAGSSGRPAQDYSAREDTGRTTGLQCCLGRAPAHSSRTPQNLRMPRKYRRDTACTKAAPARSGTLLGSIRCTKAAEHPPCGVRMTLIRRECTDTCQTSRSGTRQTQTGASPKSQSVLAPAHERRSSRRMWC